MEDVREDKETESVQAHIGPMEVVLICFIWACGIGSIGILVATYHDGQKVSLENAIAYIMIGVVLVSGVVLFRDQIAAVINDWREDH